MTTPKVSTIQRSGSRYYIHPEDPALKVPGVTSVLGMLPKGFLRYWAAKVVAETAVEDLQALNLLAARDRDGAVDYLKRAPDRDTRNAADNGTDAHDYFERMALGEEITETVLIREGKDHILPFVAHYQDFLDTVQPEFHFLEETVWSDTHLYAGSFDAFLSIEGEKAWADNKTTRSGVHEEVGLQLAAYRYADNIIRKDGSRVPMPKANGGVVIHVRPEGWKVVPVRCGPEEFEVFLHLRQIFDFETLHKKGILGDPIFAGGSASAKTGPKRAVPRARRAAK